MNNDFRNYAVKHMGISSTTLDSYVAAANRAAQAITSSYISPTIIEERQLNVAQMDVFSRLMMDRYGNMELPAEVLKKWLIGSNEGVTAENVDEEYTRIEPQLKWQLIKERMASLLEIKIEEADLIDHAKSIAARQFAQYGMTNIDDETLTDYAKRILADKEYRPRLVEQVGDIKLFNAAMAKVTLDQQTVSLDRFKEIAEGK